MAIGSQPYTLSEPKPVAPLNPDDSYFLVRIKEAQAYFQAGMLTSGGEMAFATSVTSPFSGGQAVNSLFKVETYKKNTPCRLGIVANLTDWLPARQTDTVKIEIKFTVVKNSALKTVLDQIQSNDLISKVSAVAPEWGGVMKVSLVAGKFLDSLAGGSGPRTIFTMNHTLTLAALSSGHIAVVGSDFDQDFPAKLELKNGKLVGGIGDDLSTFSYVILEILAMPRLGPEAARGTSWWQLLDAARQSILDDPPEEDTLTTRRSTWRDTLHRVRTLAKEDTRFLQKETTELIQEAQKAVEPHLRPNLASESTGDEDYSHELQKLLGASNPNDLARSVAAYRAAVAASESLRTAV